MFRKKSLNLIKTYGKITCGIAMPSESTKILEFNQYRKYIICADLESLIKRIDGCKIIIIITTIIIIIITITIIILTIIIIITIISPRPGNTGLMSSRV